MFAQVTQVFKQVFKQSWQTYGGLTGLDFRSQADFRGKFGLKINGQKKWITNGVFADYFTVAVRTGAPDSGAKGMSYYYAMI